MRLSVAVILDAVPGARLACGDAGTVVDGAFVDSRAPRPGALFVGVVGESLDGGRFAAAALRDGAGAAVVGPEAWEAVGHEAAASGRPVIVADRPLEVLQAAGLAALRALGAPVIAVTGSVGKTTTKDILVAMLRAAGRRAEGTPGNNNTEVGVPMALMGLPEDTQVAVVEMGMRGTGQIAELVRLAPPEVACITGIAPVHLELLGTMEAVAAAKAEILTGLRPGGTAVVPAGEPLLAPHLAALPAGVHVVEFDDLDGDVDVDLDKAWQRRNAAAALACCRAIGAAPAPGTRVTVQLSAMRGQEFGLPGGGVCIEDCYNANPAAMRAALSDLARRPGRRVAVLGDMFELGPDAAAFHRGVGELVAQMGIDLLVAVGDLAANYVDGAAGVPAVRFADGAEAAAGIAAVLDPGDVVLVKASRGMALERVTAALRAHAAGTPA
ncbi:MAG: UDP-N-acetylmuramoyl-tripeptide--D-alanyl-D-alanine ligase [Thermoleophilia bacterium]